MVEAAYRVRPDRRFVNAVADIVEIAGGSQQNELTVDFAEGKWRVSAGETATIRLPELATFDDALAELTLLASKQPRREKVASPKTLLAAIDADLAVLRPDLALPALKRLDAAAAGRALDGAGMQRAARAATLLTMGATDPFAISDTLMARALALLASARVLDASCCREEQTLLASFFGYTTEAKKLAASLPSGSLARAAIMEAGAEPELPAEPSADFAALQKEHEKSLDSARDAGRLLGERAVRSLLEARWYSRLHRQFLYLHEEMGLPEELDELVKSLTPRSPTGAQVVAWMAQNSKALYGRLERRNVSQALRAATLLGGESKYKLFESIRRGLGTQGPGVRECARELYLVLDSRPQETLVASRLSETIGHVRKHRLYLESSILRAPQEHGDLASALFAAGDRSRLFALARDPSAGVHDRVAALYYLSAAGEPALHKDFEDAIRDGGYDPAHLDSYLEYLDKRKEPQIKERFVRLVLASNPGLDAIYRANVTSFLVDALARQGRYEEAWKAAEPQVAVFSAYILGEAVPVLERLGRKDEAISLGRKMIERYPSADMRGDFAIALWRMGRHAEAAALFDPTQNPSALETFGEHVPPKFVEAFPEGAELEALRAYEELIRHSLPAHMMMRFSSAALTENRWALARALEDRFQRIPYPSEQRGYQESSLISGYRATRELEGEQAGLRWILERSTPQSQLHQMMALLMEQQTDLIVGMATVRPPAGQDLAQSAVVALALAARRTRLSDPRWNVVRSLLPDSSQVPGDQKATYFGVLHLLGEAEETAVIDAEATQTGRTIAAFFIGARAIADGRRDDAIRDLLVASEGPPEFVPTSWAISFLYILRAEEQRMAIRDAPRASAPR